MLIFWVDINGTTIQLTSELDSADDKSDDDDDNDISFRRDVRSLSESSFGSANPSPQDPDFETSKEYEQEPSEEAIEVRPEPDDIGFGGRKKSKKSKK